MSGRIFIPLLIAMSALTALSFDMYLPTLPDIAREFQLNETQLQWTLSAFLWGFSVAQLWFGPLSDRFGRKPTLILGFVTYAAANLGCAFSPSLPALIVSRFLQGVGACCGVVTSNAIVRDRFDRGYAIKLLSYIGMAIALAPMIAPTLGAIVSLTVGWRGIFFVLMTFALLVLVLCHFFLPETNKRKVSMAPRELMRGYLSVLMHPSHMAHSLINVFLFAALICFVTSAPHIFMMDLGGTKQEFAFYFGFNAVILMLGNFVVSRVSHRVGFIPMMAVASCLTIVGGTLIAYFARNHEVTTAWRILVPMMLVSLGLTFGAPNSLTGALAPFPDRAGMAAALNGCLKFAAVGLVAWLLSLTPGYRAHWMGIYMCACGVAALIFCAIVWRMPASHDWAASGTAADIASELGATH